MNVPESHAGPDVSSGKKRTIKSNIKTRSSTCSKEVLGMLGGRGGGAGGCLLAVLRKHFGTTAGII